jgi:hypothetical protein
MNFRLIYTETYIKKASKFLRKYPEIVSQYEKALKILETDPVILCLGSIN